MLEQLLEKINNNFKDYGGAIIIKPKSSNEKSMIKSYILNNDLSISFSDLSVSYENALLLRYRPKMLGFNVKNATEKAREYYYEGDYDNALKCYLNLLKVGKPKSSFYMRIASCYVKLHNIGMAVRYYEIAYYIDRKLGCNVSDLKIMIDSMKMKYNINNDNDYNKKLNSFVSSILEYFDEHENLKIHLKYAELGSFKYVLRLYPSINIENITSLEDGIIEVYLTRKILKTDNVKRTN